MKKKSIIYLIIIVTLINLSALGTMIYNHWIDPDRSTDAVGRKARFEQVKHELSLTPFQIKRFKEIRAVFHSRLDSLDIKMEGLRQQLLLEIWQPHSETERTDKILFKISQLQTESQRMVIWHFYQFKEVLTPGQWQNFYGFVSEQFCIRGK